jgi:hypothetical protein
MKFLYPTLVLLLCVHLAHAQGFSSSNLPIVIINTDNNAPIPDEPGVLGNMKIIYRGPGLRNYVTDKDSAAFLNYNGRVDIEIRGSYSQAFPKKAYGFTTLQADNSTNNNVSLLGMPEENDWVLHGLSSDPSLIRDYLSHNLSRQIGQYAIRTVYCEVVVNGDYRGLYFLGEKIKPDKNRVNVEKIEPADQQQPELSGGYITKTDKTTGGDPIAWQMSSYIGFNDNGFIHHWPKPEDVTAAQNAYIKSVFVNLQTVCTAGNSSITTGFPTIIDLPSFYDYILINELASNADAYTYSTYYHKDRNGKLRAGPVWDMNLTYGNDLFEFGFDRSKPDVWQFYNGSNEGPRYIRDLFNNQAFRCYLSRRWNELTQPGMPLHPLRLEQYIDSTVALISEAAARENARWGTVVNHAFAVNTLKNWLDLRIPWMTVKLGSFSGCSNPVTPPLVISKIHYHPDATPAIPEEDQLEFLEITNAGNTNINLTGLYFGGTGLVYSFPAGHYLLPGATLHLASDAAAFQQAYGFAPFGQFSRNLSNSNQLLLLLDAFGNEIDRVHYRDDAPWPDADGNGRYLQLISVDLDNSLASSWEAVGGPLVSTEQPDAAAQEIRVYPNPTTGRVHLQSDQKLETLEVTDWRGHLLQRFDINAPAFELDLGELPTGGYILRISNEEGVWVRMVVRG